MVQELPVVGRIGEAMKGFQIVSPKLNRFGFRHSLLESGSLALDSCLASDFTRQRLSHGSFGGQGVKLFKTTGGHFSEDRQIPFRILMEAVGRLRKNV